MPQAAIIGDQGKPHLHMPCETVHPNKLAGDYIIALVLTLPRGELFVLPSTSESRTKIYVRSGVTYVCPQQEQAPPGGHPWRLVGRKYGREVYSFTRWYAVRDADKE